jgi:DNA-binding GntR family transcriptional regulator
MSDLAAPGGHGEGRKPGLRYVSIADDIESRIRSGELAPGTRLRSERELADYYKVAYVTQRQAMKVLRERGLITTIHGQGTYVSEPGS